MSGYNTLVSIYKTFGNFATQFRKTKNLKSMLPLCSHILPQIRWRSQIFGVRVTEPIFRSQFLTFRVEEIRAPKNIICPVVLPSLLCIF